MSGYTVIVARRLRVQTTYKPVFEDWLFHVLLPFSAYAALAVSACAAHPRIDGSHGHLKKLCHLLFCEHRFNRLSRDPLLLDGSDCMQFLSDDFGD